MSDAPVTTIRPNYIISVDIEADGEAPTVSSCVELGIVVADADTGCIVDRRNWMMKNPAGHVATQRCIEEFWHKTPENRAHLIEIHASGVTPQVAMAEFATWWKETKDRATRCTWIARPASYDWQWVNGWYEKFGPADKVALPFSVTCLSTMIRTLETLFFLKKELDESFAALPTKMTHTAVEDAEHQLGMYLVTSRYFKIMSKLALAK